MRKIAFLIIVLTLLSGCYTHDLLAEERTCIDQWMDRIPPEFEEKLVNKTRWEDVPDGTYECTTTTTDTGVTTKCTADTKRVMVDYVEMDTVDVRDMRHRLNPRYSHPRLVIPASISVFPAEAGIHLAFKFRHPAPG